MRPWIDQACNKATLFRSARIALVVGTLLAVINYGDRMATGAMDSGNWIRAILSYFVPFLVATYSSISACQQENSGDSR